MSDCKSYEEYVEKFGTNQQISGYGLEVTMHVPCPFCAEPDFMIHKVIDTEQAYVKGATCKFCGRSIRGIINRDAGGITMRIVQTGGDPAPDWFPVPIVRE